MHSSSTLYKGTILRPIQKNKVIKLFDASSIAQGCFLLTLRGLLAQSVKFDKIFARGFCFVECIPTVYGRYVLTL